MNMKDKKLLFGAAVSTVIVTALLLLPLTGEGAYESRINSNSNSTQGIAGTFEFYNQIRQNVNTGVYNREEYLRAKDEANLMASNRAVLSWGDQGPDNVGGRTRAILIDIANDNHIFAGSVSGGLFVSNNRGSNWTKVDGFADNLGISSMCMTDDGTIYIGTGHSAESTDGTTGGADSGANGEGVFISIDNGVSFKLMIGTEGYSYINEVVAKGNDVFIAASSGLQKYSGGSLSLTSATGGTKALSISPDGNVIIAQSGPSTMVSTDGGVTFSTVFIGVLGSRYEFAISHEQIAGKYYIYGLISTNAGSLAGVVKSANNGATWTQIAPANTNGNPNNFEPFGSQTQGTYDNIITVVKGDPESILIGGINIYAKSTTGNWEQRSNNFVPQLSPIYVHSDQHEMQWDSQGRLWCGNDGGVFYSDDNGETFRESDRGYNVTQFYKIGFSAHGDVIGGTQDNGTLANYHDNATYKEHDEVRDGDGFGCAMSFINRDVLFTTIYFGAINRSGNRGDNSTAYTAANIPTTWGTPGSVDGGLGSFNTAIKLYENPNDLNSKDTIIVPYDQDYPIGENILVNSLTSQQTIEYTTIEALEFQDTLDFDPALTTLDTVVRLVLNVPSIPSPLSTDTLDDVNLNSITYTMYLGSGSTVEVGDQIVISATLYDVIELTTLNHYYGTLVTEPGEIVDMGLSAQITNVAWDTIRVIDPVQSWFALGLGESEGVWLTRNSLRLAANHDGFLQVADQDMLGTVTAMEFSKDGNHLFVGTSEGQVWRVSGLADVYSPDPNVESSITDFTTFELVKSFGGKYVTGLSSDKQNVDQLIVTLGNYGGTFNNIQRTTTATQGTNINFTTITGDMPFSTGTPFYSCVMDRDNSNIILVGCDFGVFLTENGGTTWENVSGDFGNTPVFDLGQNWRTWDEGCYVPGEIYAGTHGRGIWSTTTYLGVQEAQDNLESKMFEADILVYPNPVVDFGTISFNLESSSNVTIQIFNLSGQIVQNINKINLNEGTNTLSINTSEFSRGTYIVRLTADNLSKTTKFVKH